MMVAGVGTGVGFSNLKNCRTWCQAKFLTSVKFLTYFCLSAILLLRVKNYSLAFSFYTCVVQTFWLDVRHPQQAIVAYGNCL